MSQQSPYPTPLAPSIATSFWHGYPRFGFSNTFDTTTNYIKEIIFVAIPYLVVAIFLFVVCLVGMIVRFSCLKQRFNAFERDLAKDNSKSNRLAMLLTSIFFFFLIFICGGLAFYVNQQSMATVSFIIQSINSCIEKIRSIVEMFGEIYNTLLAKAQAINIPSVPPDKVAQVQEVKQFLQSNAQVVQDIYNTVHSTVDELVSVLDMAETAQIIVFAVLACVILLIVIAPVFVFFITTSLGICGRVILNLLYFISMVLSWILLGASASAGCAIGDACMMIYDFQVAILYQVGESNTTASDDNFFIRNGVGCPAFIAPDVTNNIINWMSNSTLSTRLEGFAYLVNTTAIIINQTLAYAYRFVDEMINCELLAKYVGMITQFLCGDGVSAAVTATYALYIVLFIIALTLTLLFICVLFGIDASEFLTRPIDPHNKMRNLADAITEVEPDLEDFEKSPVAYQPDPAQVIPPEPPATAPRGHSDGDTDSLEGLLRGGNAARTHDDADEVDSLEENLRGQPRVSTAPHMQAVPPPDIDPDK